MSAPPNYAGAPWAPGVGAAGEPPPFDEEWAAGLTGLTILGGLTYLNPNGEVEHQVQFHGRIISASRDGIVIRCDGTTWNGQEAVLPPDKRAFQIANRGDYRLRSTGETVVDPDLTTTWTISRPLVS